MKFKYLMVALAATAATPAMAQDFAGPRAEVRAGWTKVDIEAELDGEEDSVNEEAVTFGGEIGFDAQLNSFVLGGYAGVDYGEAEFCDEVFGGDEACLEVGRNFTVGARAGVPIGTAALLYVKGGYSNGRLGVSFDDDVSDNIDAETESDSLDGFHIGVGAELAGGPNVYVKAEYVYTKYDGSESNDEDFDSSFDLSRHQALFGVGFRF